MNNISIGTCSWNYHSWTGSVYTKAQPSPADYLPEYSKKYNTVEIDSWFYRIPSRSDVSQYTNKVPKSFRFTCKAIRDLTMPFFRTSTPSKNPKFLSPELFSIFCDAIEPMLGQMDMIMLEFEYLNKEKMKSLPIFIDMLNDFINKIKKPCPIGIEIRNSNYLKREYFDFLDINSISHVFSEKQYMPHVYDLYDKFRNRINNITVIRLLGDDRKAVEKLTGNKWDKIVLQSDDLEKIIDMSLDIKHKVIINVNNHYEGSAPLTIEHMKALYRERGVEL